MNTVELIKTARECGQRTTDCKGCPLDGKEDCLVYLSGQLADKLEMALADISRNCGNCMHKGDSLEKRRCLECLAHSYRKHWKWRGDRDE